MELRKRFADFAHAVLRRCQSNAWFWIALWVVSVLIAAVVVSTKFWCWLGAGESGSTTIRNLGLVVAAIIALPLAIWRSVVAQRQADTAQRGLLNERYQKGAEMLDSDVLAVRLGGIYALGRLARGHPADYHTQIMSILCAFLRNPVKPTKVKEKVEEGIYRLREDVQEIVTVIRERSEAQVEIEKKEKYELDLNRVNLDSVNTILMGANLTDAILIWANLRNALLVRANLTGANLVGTILHNTNLTGAILKGPIHGLTQAQLDEAWANEDNPPDLTDAFDIDTGKPLVWRGSSVDKGA